MRRFFSLALLCLLPSQFFGQAKGPQDVQVPIGRLASVKILIDGEESKYAVLGEESFGAFREFSQPNEWNLKILGYQDGIGYIVVTAVKGGKLQEPLIVKITIGKGTPQPNPNPAPNPNPVPVPPEDPIVNQLRDAARVASWPGLASLAKGLQLCYDLTDNAVTVERYVSATKAALKAANPEGVPDTVFNIVATEAAKLDTIINPKSPPGTNLTAEGKEAAKAIFLRLSRACEKASK